MSINLFVYSNFIVSAKKFHLFSIIDETDLLISIDQTFMHQDIYLIRTISFKWIFFQEIFQFQSLNCLVNKNSDNAPSLQHAVNG